MDAIILAGGLGTRLREVVSDVPKPLAPIRGKPFLHMLLRVLARETMIQRVILALGYRAEAVIEACAGQNYPFALGFSIEKTLLGTGGAMKQALMQTQSDEVVVLNGDSFCELDLVQMLEFHRIQQAEVTLACCRVEETSRYGSVVFEGDRIVAFREKEVAGGAGWINGGVYLLQRSMVLPQEAIFSLERDLFPSILNKGVFGYRASGTFIDIGTKQSYEEAQGVLCNVY